MRYEYRYVNLSEHRPLAHEDIGNVLTQAIAAMGEGWRLVCPFNAERWSFIVVREIE